jgi:ATP-dependent Clp protease ATP-binding subunit ClpB
MTSNMGSQIIQEKFENLKGSMEEATEAAKEEVSLIKTNCSSRIHQPHR